MTKDWVKTIAKIISGGDTRKLADAVAEGLAEIDKDLKLLQEQASIIRRLGAYYAPTWQISDEREPEQPVAQAGPVAKADGLTSKERSALVKKAALSLAQQGHSVLSARDVLSELRQQGTVFTIHRPASMVGTVLSRMPEFERRGMDQFYYRGENGKQVRPMWEDHSGERPE